MLRRAVHYGLSGSEGADPNPPGPVLGDAAVPAETGPRVPYARTPLCFFSLRP